MSERESPDLPGSHTAGGLPSGLQRLSHRHGHRQLRERGNGVLDNTRGQQSGFTSAMIEETRRGHGIAQCQVVRKVDAIYHRPVRVAQNGCSGIEDVLHALPAAGGHEQRDGPLRIYGFVARLLLIQQANFAADAVIVTYGQNCLRAAIQFHVISAKHSREERETPVEPERFVPHLDMVRVLRMQVRECRAEPMGSYGRMHDEIAKTLGVVVPGWGNRSERSLAGRRRHVVA